MKKTLMIAHRGYSKFEKENTLMAFSVAGGIDDFYGIETDVHVTNDGKFITIHDEETGRITNNAININVEKNNYETVANVRLPDIDNDYDRSDLRIPLMKEYFKICKKYHKHAVCELKQLFTKKQIQEIIDIIKDLDMFNDTTFISFYYEDLLLVRELEKDVEIQLLLCDFKPEYLDEYCLPNHFDVDVLHSAMNQEYIDLIHSKGLKVNVWTVDDQELVNKYALMGVDFITSNAIKKISD